MREPRSVPMIQDEIFICTVSRKSIVRAQSVNAIKLHGINIQNPQSFLRQCSETLSSIYYQALNLKPAAAVAH